MVLVMVFVVFDNVLVVLMVLVIVDQAIAQSQSQIDPLLGNTFAVHLGSGRLLIHHSLGLTASDGPTEHTEQTQLERKAAQFSYPSNIQ